MPREVVMPSWTIDFRKWVRRQCLVVPGTKQVTEFLKQNPRFPELVPLGYNRLDEIPVQIIDAPVLLSGCPSRHRIWVTDAQYNALGEVGSGWFGLARFWETPLQALERLKEADAKIRHLVWVSPKPKRVVFVGIVTFPRGIQSALNHARELVERHRHPPVPYVPTVKPRKRNLTVYRADAAGVFKIEDGTRFSSFGPIQCPECALLMTTAQEDDTGRAWVLKCEQDHEKRDIAHGSF
jgi:hypothetical protein